MQAHQSKHCIGGSTSRERERERGRERERERERERDVCVLFEFRQIVVFFYSGNTLGTRLRISKFCVDLCKKSDRTRCLAVSIINWNSKSAERAKAL